MEWVTLERRLREYFAGDHEGIAAAYLFGSVARGTAGPGSDVDVAVLYEVNPPATLEGLPLDVEGELERTLGLPVQVVLLNASPPDLVHHVLRDARLLLDRNPAARIEFEVRARNEFFDLQPVLERYRLGGETCE